MLLRCRSKALTGENGPGCEVNTVGAGFGGVCRGPCGDEVYVDDVEVALRIDGASG